MILTCPNCSTRFLIESESLGGKGRMVRCGRCGHAWFQDSTAPGREAYEPPPIDTPGPIEPDLPPTPDDAPARSSGRTWLLAWFVFVFVLAAIVLGAYKYRDDFVAIWPPAAKLYAFLGIPIATPAGYGLIVPPESVLSRWDTVANQHILIIEGRIKNVTDQPRKVGPMVITLRDKNEKSLRRWRFAPESRTLPAGASMPFKTRLRNAPRNAADARFEFLRVTSR